MKLSLLSCLLAAAFPFTVLAGAVSASGNATTNHGVVTTVIGGKAGEANFRSLTSLAVGPTGKLYVVDSLKNALNEISPDGKVRLVAGGTGVEGAQDGTGPAAHFREPGGVAVDAQGNVFVCDTGNRTLRKVTPQGVVSTFAGRAGHEGSADGKGAAASFAYPVSLTIDKAGNLYVLDPVSGAGTTSVEQIRRITPAGVVTTLLRLKALSPTDSDATEPNGIAVDGQGTLYVSDGHNNLIRAIKPGGLVTTLAGAHERGLKNGRGTRARFNVPAAITIDARGNLFVADTDNHLIRQVAPGGVVTTLAGSVKGTRDGTGAAARFDWPSAIAAAPDGSLYVLDGSHLLIRKIR